MERSGMTVVECTYCGITETFEASVDYDFIHPAHPETYTLTFTITRAR